MATSPFNDVHSNQWYAEAVQFVYENNIMDGVGSNQFHPQGNLTRAQVTVMLFRIHNERPANAEDDRTNKFNDVGDTWYAPYITWAFNHDIVLGTSPTTFNPHGNVTRQEFATMVHRYAMSRTLLRDGSGSWQVGWRQFADIGQIATWAYDALRWMHFSRIVTGWTPTTINPKGITTRAEAAVMMMRFIPQIPLTPFVVCLGCGDKRTFWIPSLDSDFEDNSVIVSLVRCVSQRDNRDWTLDDFGNIGALYIRDLMRLSDRCWELLEAGRLEETMWNWPQFRRILLIRLDQNCKENVINVVQQLQELEFVYAVGSNGFSRPA